VTDGQYRWPHCQCIAEEQWFDGEERLRVEAVSDGERRFLLFTRTETGPGGVTAVQVLLHPEQVAWLRFSLGRWTNSHQTNSGSAD
jgi:hypothetical protein